MRFAKNTETADTAHTILLNAKTDAGNIGIIVLQRWSHGLRNVRTTTSSGNRETWACPRSPTTPKRPSARMRQKFEITS